MTSADTLRIGTRGSRLALAQAEIVSRALLAAGSCGRTELVVVQTEGDAISAARPRGGFENADGQFTVALEQALVNGDADLAVHSLKDLPTAERPGLVLAAVPRRADPRDCLISRHPGGLDGLPPGATVGTSSPRRDAQLRAARSDLRPMPIRGNVETRVSRVEHGEYDAVMLAGAGLDRLGLPVPEDSWLSLDAILPAPAQGALAVQARADQLDLLDAVASIEHRPSREAAEAERRLLQLVGGGCLAPLGALVEFDTTDVRVRAAYPSTAGSLSRVDVSGHAQELGVLVLEAAEQLTRGGTER